MATPTKMLFASNSKAIVKPIAPPAPAPQNKVPATADDWHAKHAHKFMRNAHKNKK